MLSSDIFFQGWSGVVRILLIGIMAYVALIIILRVTGKRTLSKLNAFDFIVTIALGSTLATVITSKDLPLVNGITALFVLVLLQLVVTWLSVHWDGFDRLIKAEPSLLLRAGVPITGAMRRERVTTDELLASIRQSGGRDLEDAEAVFLETDGSLTAILRKSS